MPLFSNKAATNAARDLEDAEQKKGSLAAEVETVSSRQKEQAARRDEAKQELDQAVATRARLSADHEGVQRRLAELQNNLRGLRVQLEEQDAQAAEHEAEAAVHSERLACLQRRAAAFQLASGSIPLAFAADQQRSEVGQTHMPLVGLAAEAGRIAEMEQGSMEEQLAEAVAKIAAWGEEQRRHETERESWVLQSMQLREELGSLVEQRDRAKESLTDAEQEVEQLRVKRAALEVKLEVATKLKERFNEDKEKIHSSMGCQRQTVEDIRGFTHRQLAEANDAVGRTSKSWQAMEAEHQQQRRQIAKRAAAHSKVLADSAFDKPLRVKLPDPASLHMETALQRAAIASSPRDQLATVDEEDPRGPFQPRSGDPHPGVPPRAAKPECSANESSGMPLNDPEFFSEQKARPAAAAPCRSIGEAASPDILDRGFVEQQDGTFAWAPDLNGPRARAPMSPRKKGAAPAPAFSQLLGPAPPPALNNVLPSSGSSSRRSSAGRRPSSARLHLGSDRMRGDLVGTGQLVIASARG